MTAVFSFNGLIAFMFGIAGNALIYSGLAFINGKLLPGVFGAVYAHTGTVSRTLIMTLTFAALANYMISYVYRLVDPAFAGMAVLVSVVITVVAKSIFLGEGTFDLRLALAVGVLALCAAWVNYELHRL